MQKLSWDSGGAGARQVQAAAQLLLGDLGRVGGAGVCRRCLSAALSLPFLSNAVPLLAVVQTVLEPMGFEVLAVGRCPYLDQCPDCGTFELDDLLLVLRRRA